MTTIDPVVAPSPAGLLLEREQHLGAFATALQDVSAGAGTTILVVGEAGVGKSMLLRELTRAAASATVLRARGDELEQEFPYGVVRQLLEPLTRTLDDVWQGPAELARSVFDPSPQAGDDASFARQQGLYWLVVNLAERLGPIVLAVDDAHRADEPSLRFLRFLGHRLDGLAVAQLLASRPLPEIEHRPALADMLDDPLVHTLAVDRLSPAATELYLEQAWPEGTHLARVCHELTAGNPLMLRALVAEARGNVDSEEALRTLGVRPIGQRVRRALSGSPAALALAQAIAVLGDDTSAAEALAFAEVAPEAVEALLRANILEEGTNGLRFVHPLVRTSVYRLLSPVERAAQHGRAAAALHARGVAGEQVAAHLLHTAPVGESWVAQELEAAAERALSAGAPDTAAGLLARALKEPGAAGERRARTLARLADAQSSAGLPDAIANYERARALAPADVQITLQYSGALAMSGRTADAFAVLDRATLPDEPTIRAALHAAALFTESAEALAHRDAVARGLPDSGLLAGTTAYELAMRNAPAAQVAALAVPTFTHGGPPLELSTTMAYGYGVWALMLSGQLDVARTELDRAVEVGRRTGALVIHALALVLRAGTHLRLGALQAAEADAQQSLALSEHPSWRFGNAGTMQFLAEILIEQGRVEEAAAAVAAIDAQTVQPLPVLLLAEQARGRVLLAQRRPDAALAAAEALGRRAQAAICDNPVFLPWRRTAALSAAAAGQPERAASLAAEHLALARAYGIEADALLTHALVTRDLDALEAVAAQGAPLVRARALLALGRARRVAGSPAAAREPLRQAMELASACSAKGLVDEALDELAAAGAKPRRRGGHGALGLTAAEARVARLAADGASNREIAQELFVTLKTVEMHLSSAYRKLDISSRAQLASRLD